jgi:3-oxoacyl-[acyl-carrier protein] reductase
MNKFDFKNRIAVITGGGQGFGLDIAKRFLESGAKVIIWDIDEELLKSAVKLVDSPNLSYNVIDVSNYSQIEKAVSEITSINNIDILINRNYRAYSTIMGI